MRFDVLNRAPCEGSTCETKLPLGALVSFLILKLTSIIDDSASLFAKICDLMVVPAGAFIAGDKPIDCADGKDLIGSFSRSAAPS